MQGFVVFVKNGKVGNKIKVKVTEVAERFSKVIIAGKIASISDFYRNKKY